MTLYQTLSPAQANTIVRAPIAVVLAILVLTISAKIAVPFYPVPMTMQTLAVIGLGFALGPRLGVVSMLSYLALGAMGLPVFTGTPEKGLGLPYLMGPTGGYLAGMIPAIWVAGALACRGWDRNFFKASLAALLSAAIIYVPGVLYLGSLIGWDKPVLELGFFPFVLGDVFKALLAGAIFSASWRMLGRKGKPDA